MLPLLRSRPPLRNRNAIILITVAIGLSLMGSGLLGSLIGVRAERAGFGAGITGVAMAMYYAGFVVGMPVMNRVLGAMVKRRMFAVCTVSMGLTAAGYGLVVVPAAWLALRFATGFFLAGCYLVVETWLNGLARNDNRGKVMGLYVAVVAAGMMLGQLVLGLTNASRWWSFAISGAITALAFAPLALVSNQAGDRHVRAGGMRVRDVARAVPSGVIGFLLVGMTQGCLLTMGSVYAARAGLSAGRVGVFVAAIMLGSVLLQMPIGALGDRMSRRLTMTLLCVASIGACVGLLVAQPGSPPAVCLAFVLGGVSTPLYALGNAYTHDWLPPGQTVAASSALLITYSVGAVTGPLIAAVAMTLTGEQGYFWALIGGHGLLAAFMIVRMIVAPDTPSTTAELQPLKAQLAPVVD